jgi:DNA-directed RNA polymerase specialized sigma24 family protein
VNHPTGLAGQGLTPAELALFQSEPGLPAQAAKEASKAAGMKVFDYLKPGDLAAIAAVGALEATRTYDPAGETPYRAWAYFNAVRAVLDAARWENRAHAKIRALLRASACVYFAGAPVGVDVGFETDASLLEKLHGFTNPVLGLAIAYVATLEPETGGEDEVIAVETAARTGDALRELLPAPGTVQRQVIDLHFVQGLSLAQVAEVLGYEKSAYTTFWRNFQALMSWLRTGLVARGINQRPAWREEVSGRVLGDPADDP